MSNRHDAAMLRQAAQQIEREWPYRPYPCLSAVYFAGGSWMRTEDLPGRFIRAMAPGVTVPENGVFASNRYLRRVRVHTPPGRDHSILALCFAAAMAETGDLP